MAEYTDEQIEEIKAAARAEAEKTLTAKFEEDTAGLKAHADKVLAEKKAVEEKSKATMLELEQKAIDEAKAKGELEKALELEKAQSERKLAELSQSKDSALEMLEQMKAQKISDANLIAVKDIASKFAKQDKLSQLTASQLVSHEFNEDGQVVAQYKNLDGEVVSDSFENWLEWAKKDPDMQQHLAGSKASGINNGDLKPSKTNIEQHKGDVQGFLNNALGGA